jgi:hypothetical protein
MFPMEDPEETFWEVILDIRRLLEDPRRSMLQLIADRPAAAASGLEGLLDPGRQPRR